MSDRLALTRHVVATQDELRPGEYMQTPRTALYGDAHWAIVRCPSCSTLMSIGRVHHDVDHNGDVTPWVACPHECVFSQWCRLEDWLPETKGRA